MIMSTSNGQNSESEEVEKKLSRPQESMGQWRLASLGLSPAARRHIKQSLKRYSNRRRRQQGREIINNDLQDLED
jgi:hypothetical protein